MELGSVSGVTYPKGSIIYVDGFLPNFLYIIKKGEVKMIRHEKKHLFPLGIYKTGDILNEVDVLKLQKSKNIAVAHTDCEIVEISAHDIKHILNKSPKWINELFKTLCDRYSDSEEIVSQNSLTIGTRDKILIITKEEEAILFKKIEEFKN